MSEDYGVLAGLVAGVGSLAAAAAAIGAAWTRNAQWAPPANDVPEMPARIASVLAAVLIVILWVNTPILGGRGLQTWATNAAGVLLVSGLLYAFLMMVYVFKVEKVVGGNVQTERVIGGFWMNPEAKRQLKKAKTTQKLLEGAAFDVDALWPRGSRGALMIAFVAAFIAVIVSGSTAMSSAALLLDPRSHSTALPDETASTNLPTPASLRAEHVEALTTAQIQEVARAAGLERAALQAFVEVGGDPAGFDATRRPIMRYQPHIFSRLTGRRYDAQAPLVSNATFSPRGRVTPDEQWDSLERAYALDPTNAFMAAEWGRYRIPGTAYSECGHRTLGSFLREVSSSERAQLEIVVYMLDQRGLLERLRQKHWSEFATAYFGAGQIDRYGPALEAAYRRAGGT